MTRVLRKELFSVLYILLTDIYLGSEVKNISYLIKSGFDIDNANPLDTKTPQFNTRIPNFYADQHIRSRGTRIKHNGKVLLDVYNYPENVAVLYSCGYMSGVALDVLNKLPFIRLINERSENGKEHKG